MEKIFILLIQVFWKAEAEDFLIPFETNAKTTKLFAETQIITDFWCLIKTASPVEFKREVRSAIYTSRKHQNWQWLRNDYSKM